VDEALTHLDNVPDQIARPLRDVAHQTADTPWEDFTIHADEASLARDRRVSPHSARLMQAWMESMPRDRILHNAAQYDQTLQHIETEFSNRPELVLAACEWCNLRGDFDRSLKLLLKIDQIEPSPDVCSRLARLYRHMGQHDEAIAQLMRSIKLGGGNENAYQQAAVDLIEDHRFDEALACLEMSADAPTSRIWQLMARCDEAMGRLDDADECLRQQAAGDPPSIAQHYMWAKRLGRNNLKEIRHKAQQAFIQPSELLPEFFMAMTEDQDHKAFDILRRYRGSMDDAFEFAQLAILAKKQNDPASLNDAFNAMATATENNSFGTALKSLAQAKDLNAALVDFDLWSSRQLYDEDAVDWYSLAGRYLLAAGHPDEAKKYLIRALHQSARERGNFYLAWRELLKMGEKPQELMKSMPTTQG
jgi:tetratricopeptide (TPR) repeat protein